MNYLMHLLVAQSVDPAADPAYHFGAMWPDLSRGWGVPLSCSDIPASAFRAGIDLNTLTNRSWAEMPAFNELHQSLEQLIWDTVPDLNADIVNAWSTAGVELLLDGYAYQLVHDAFMTLLAHCGTGALGLGELPSALRAQMAHAAVMHNLHDYRNPCVVGLRARHHFADTPGLSVHNEQLPGLTEAFRSQQHSVLQSAPDIVEHLRDTLCVSV